MDPYVTLSMVDYIQLLHAGSVDRSLYEFYTEELAGCTPLQAAIAIDNLIIRWGNIGDIERTVARFIRAVARGLDACGKPEFPPESIVFPLSSEHAEISLQLEGLRKVFMEVLPDLKSGDRAAQASLGREIEMLQSIRVHYLKLQNELFPALEAAGAPALCTRLMWYLQDAIWTLQRECMQFLTAEKWDYARFSRIYGQLFFRISSLLYREDKILFPVACSFI